MKSLRNLESIMREAGELARATTRGAFKSWNKERDNSPVSDGDIAVNNYLREQLMKLRPDAGWLSEETEERIYKPITWIVDPIDGTRAYISGRTDWTISVALVENGQPIWAALYAPVTEEMFLAAKDEGAFRNGAAIQTAADEALTGARIAGPKRYLERLAQFEASALPQPKVYSLALRLARVAQGEFDAALASQGSRDWDLAAADLLVHEAGGALTDFAGKRLNYCEPGAHGPLIAAGVARHQTLLKLVRDRALKFA
jgi:myo-inositol-1(or 4)-monophosphatase